ncbi:unnamed protein product [Fraxinus pennsylvanica]|uniref:Uncharacterized protein n=1 Tax=Fraxinus pennsylvanica TaxID=56036 RepID=A0AAD1ZHZ3_9LAMI|nr:unnamed protein product [Fraxinus pennsylvanica]
MLRHSLNTTVSMEEQWKIAVAELSNKLIKATKKRDEAILEASKLKYSMAELEKKLNKREIYCHILKSGLEVCSNTSKFSVSFSEDFSKFCDRKMSEIVAMLGWTRAWSEPLLHAFFGASKSVWLVHLLANSVHPNISIFRVDKGVRFDSVYMEVVVLVVVVRWL